MKPQFTAVLLIAVFATCGVRASADDSALEKLADLVDNVVREVIGVRRRAEAPVERPVAVPQPVPVERPQDIEARRERLEAFAGAFQDWATRTSDLSDRQRAELTRVVDKMVQQAEDNWKNQDPRVRNSGLADYAPINFTAENGAAPPLTSQRLRSALQEPVFGENGSTLLKALDERQEAVRGGNLNYVVSLVDQEIFLTAEQRDAVAEDLGKRIPDLENGLFAFNPQTYYLPYASLNNAVGRLPAALLSDVQQARLQDLTQTTGNAHYLMISSDDGIDAWYDQVDNAFVEQRIRMNRGAAVRVAWLEDFLKLTSEQTRHLAIAGKGAAARCVADWKKQTREQLVQWEQRIAQQQFAGRKFSFALELPSVDRLEQSPFWMHAVARLRPADALDDRKINRRKAIVSYLTAMLEKEIWLTPDQREPFRKLVSTALPHQVGTSQPHFKELEWLVIPLFRIPEGELQALLTDAQQAAWKELQDQFQVKGRSVRLQMQNGGQFGFNLPP